MKRLLNLFWVAFFVCLLGQVYAQKSGNVTVHESYLVDDLVKKHVSINKQMNGIPGYRVQIFSDSGNNSKRRAMRAKADFLMKNDDYNAYIVFEAPYYKVEVGNFINHLNAERCLSNLKEKYPGAFIIYEPEMEFPEI